MGVGRLVTPASYVHPFLTELPGGDSFYRLQEMMTLVYKGAASAVGRPSLKLSMLWRSIGSFSCSPLIVLKYPSVFLPVTLFLPWVCV